MCIVQQFRFLAAMVGVAATAALAWSVALGAAAASAASRLRSGSLHAQLVSHVTPARQHVLVAPPSGPT